MDLLYFPIAEVLLLRGGLPAAVAALPLPALLVWLAEHKQELPALLMDAAGQRRNPLRQAIRTETGFVG